MGVRLMVHGEVARLRRITRVPLWKWHIKQMDHFPPVTTVFITTAAEALAL